MDSISHQVLSNLHTLPIELRKEIFQRYAKSKSCCIGLEVLRGPPTAQVAEYLVPNTFLAWDIYVDGQPEFRHGAPQGYFVHHVQWAREQVQNGNIRIGKSILYIDAFELLRRGSRQTILAKKALMLNMRLGVCPLVIFKIWDKIDFLTAFSCVPYSFFFEHFGKILATNPLGIQILYDHYDRPRCVWDRARITHRDFGTNPIFFVDHLTERQAHVNWENDIAPYDISRGPSWYEQRDDDDLTLDRTEGLGYGVHFRNMAPIADCNNWDVSPNHICIP